VFTNDLLVIRRASVAIRLLGAYGSQICVDNFFYFIC